MSVHSDSLSNYGVLSDTLAPLNLTVETSELQAVLCGLIAAQAQDPKGVWLDAVLNEPLDRDNLLLRSIAQAVDRLFDETQAALVGLGEDFTLLLPDDESPLAQRAEALVDWCAGFIYGLGLAGVDLESMTEDSKESLEIISDITRLDHAHIVESEAAEGDFNALMEMVWMGVMTLQADLALARQTEAEA
jgi:uncharacterized protein YgfB (UPF0149 family)